MEKFDNVFPIHKREKKTLAIDYCPDPVANGLIDIWADM